jgi:hypothetical protein
MTGTAVSACMILRRSIGDETRGCTKDRLLEDGLVLPLGGRCESRHEATIEHRRLTKARLHLLLEPEQSEYNSKGHSHQTVWADSR